ncbi:MAG: glycoside hydrolase [Flavobacteriales bacterium]|nr:MAG: glycoside hydrolase [Flavobacteriales bacterium]
MIKPVYYSVTLVLLISLFNCQYNPVATDDTVTATKVIDSIKKVYAPDKRVAIFDIEAHSKGSGLMLRGESNLPEAVKALKTNLTEINPRITDSIAILPSADLDSLTRAVVKISVANLRSKPKHSAELSTQAMLGTPLRVYKKKDDWYLVQTPDKYLGWVDSGGLELMNAETFANWKTAIKLIYLDPYGQSYTHQDAGSQPVSDVVAGDIFELAETTSKFYKVKYPDGRMAFIAQGEAQPYNDWLKGLNISEESLVNTSKKLMGLPYLWGGTSTKGVDCSGFTKMVYFLNGYVIPRDASQQIHTGETADSNRSFKNMQPGDLLFFGEPATDSTKERIVHVGMWIGNNEFIHSAGRVHISSMDKNAPNYDEYNYKRYIRSKRLLGKEDKGLLSLKKNQIFRN